MSYEMEQPVEIEFVGRREIGPVHDRTLNMFFIVRFTGDGVKPEDREKAVYADNRIKDGSVFWLHSFNRNTLEHILVPPLDISTERLSRAEAYMKICDSYYRVLDKQRVPLWLLSKLEESIPADVRENNDRTSIAERHVREAQLKLNYG